MKRALILASVTLLAFIGAAARANAKPAQSEQSGTYGNVHFPLSCVPAAQEQFDRAVAMLHSFFYPETVKAFTKITETDPTCAMAYWGIAISPTSQSSRSPVCSGRLKAGI